MSDNHKKESNSAGRAVPCKKEAPDVGDRIRRMMFTFVWFCFCSPSPVVMHGWRRWVLRIFGASMASGTLVYPNVRIWAPWNLVMDVGAVLGPEVYCYNVDEIRLGAGALVSQRAYLCSASHDANDVSFPLIAAPIVVESNAWVCTEAFVGPGVTIRSGAIVGARAVVTRDVDVRAIVVGNPARTIGRRDAAAVPEPTI